MGRADVINLTDVGLLPEIWSSTNGGPAAHQSKNLAEILLERSDIAVQCRPALVGKPAGCPRFPAENLFAHFDVSGSGELFDLYAQVPRSGLGMLLEVVEVGLLD